MKKEYADKWIEALRSGKYKQGVGSLFDGEKHCCLGVLCEVMGVIPIKHREKWKYLRHENTLPFEIMKKTDMKTDCGRYTTRSQKNLIYHNDEQRNNFNEIADIIELNWENM